MHVTFFNAVSNTILTETTSRLLELRTSSNPANILGLAPNSSLAISVPLPLLPPSLLSIPFATRYPV